MKKLASLTILAVCLTLNLLAFEQTGTTEPVTSSGGMDLFEILILVGYLLGVFILLPLVVISNIKESLFKPNENNLELRDDLSEFERNATASQILEGIENKLTQFKAEDGTELVTITKGSQSRFVKRGLDYINKHLAPTDVLLSDRAKEFEEVYNDRARRVFTGSWWIIVSSIAIGVLLFMTGGVTTFIFIHALGVLFYVLSSRTTMYGIEKRMNRIGYMPGFIGAAMSGLFLGNGTKHYVKSGNGPWKRDWETEGQMAMIGLFFMFVVSLFLGFMAALLGVLNFVINYSTSFVIPFKSDKQWFEDNFKDNQPELVAA